MSWQIWECAINIKAHGSLQVGIRFSVAIRPEHTLYKLSKGQGFPTSTHSGTWSSRIFDGPARFIRRWHNLTTAPSKAISTPSCAAVAYYNMFINGELESPSSRS